MPVIRRTADDGIPFLKQPVFLFVRNAIIVDKKYHGTPFDGLTVVRTAEYRNRIPVRIIFLPGNPIIPVAMVSVIPAFDRKLIPMPRVIKEVISTSIEIFVEI